jgi:hypothetical protein
MAEAVFFVVSRGPGGNETYAIYHDQLPGWMMGKRAKERGLLYAIRLDTLGRGAELVDLSLQQLVEQYVMLKAAGKLPASNLVPPRKEEAKRGRQLGEWWVPPAPTWDQKAPAYPYLRPKVVVDNG